jgi:hypothetical protein
MENMENLDNIKPGDVFEMYDKNRFDPDSDDESYDGSDDEMYYEPYIAREQETIYLGKEDIDGVTYGHFLTVSNSKESSYTFYYKRPLSEFLRGIKVGIYRDNRGSKIPQPLLEEIRFNVDKQKENLHVLEEEVQKKVPIELSPDVKNKILGYFAKGNLKEHYEGGRAKKTKKTRRSVKSKKIKRSRKSKKSKKSIKSRKSRKSRKH